MGNKTISVIIPVYNQLEFFKKCINSVVNQTYRELEIICVDDGSTDGVESYLDACAKEDERIIVVHQKNGGESKARNIALKKATGDYIAFVDCDDWLDEDMYESLIQMAEEDDLDIAASAWYKEASNETIIKINDGDVVNGVINRDKLLEYIYKRDVYQGFAYMWNKLYRRDVLQDKNKELLKFEEDLKLGNDVIYLAQAALNSTRTEYIEKAFYHYRIREGSGSHSKDLSRMHDWIKSYEITIRLLDEASVPMETIDYAKRFLAYHAMEATKMADEMSDYKEKRRFQTIMQEYADTYNRLNEKFPERIEEYKNLLEK